MLKKHFSSLRYSENGNIFLAIFGAVAMVGLLGASVMTFMKGPLSTSVKLTKINTAESQMTIGAQVAVMAAANQAGSGDCDADGTVEPIEWRAPTGSEPVPTGGGLVPLSLGINKRDPWGTEYGYCVWNHGTVLSGSGCGTNLRQGTNGTAYSVVALVSAGPDKTFTTTCRDFAVADANSNGLLEDGEEPLVSKNLETDDDIITTFTYEEATGVSGGLWSLKAGDPNTAVINKSIESSGVANLKGGVLLPDKSLIDCNDITNAGVMAKNGTTGIEICNGTGTWTAITGGGVTGNNLVLTPVTSTAMNVTGTCGTATCYSAQVTFTLTNKAASTSPVLASSLSNTTNFEFVSNGCNGVTLATNAECQMVVRAKATGNISYTGTLNITGGNSPFATLSGTASSFPGCNAGGQAPGGYYLACGVGGYNLVITPSGCTAGMTNPTCAGGADTLQLNPIAGGAHQDASGCCVSSDGQKNTANLQAYSQGSPVTYPAAAWCSGLIYQGYDDWFLPSTGELISYFYPNRAAVGWSNTVGYWSSNESPSGTGFWREMATTGTMANTNNASTINRFVRCMRWTPSKAVTPTLDTTPTTLSFTASYGAPAVTRTSNAVTLSGVTQPISISISGGVNAKYSINGGVYTSASGSANNGDQISLQATSPAQGQENIVTLTTGATSSNWLVRSPGNNSIRAFTTDAAAGTGDLGGVSGADALCTGRATAAGLRGSWMAVMMNSIGTPLATRLPWNWNILKNMNGQTVATSVADFLDGSISAPMNYSETGAISGGGIVWTGIAYVNSEFVGSSNTCAGWTAGVGGYIGNFGDTSQTGAGSYLNSGATGNTCAPNYRLLCMETNAAGSDLDPDEVVLTPGISFTSGANGTSNTVTVLGVTDAVTVTITPSSGTASIIKGGVNQNAMTTTAGLNETLAFVMSAPTTLGTKNTATIYIGPDVYTWWVGYADQAKEARVFVMRMGIEYGAFGGIPGADAACTQRAASSTLGLSGNWKAILSSSSSSAIDNISWNWGVLKTLDGTVVADGGFPDLWDGSLDAPINRDQNGVAQVSGYVWSGTTSTGARIYPAAPTSHCEDWTSPDPTGYCGITGNTTSTWIANSNCNCYASVNSMYCIEDVNTTTDTTPVNIVLPYPVQVATSSRQLSDPVIIGGLSSGVSTTLSVTASGGSPTFRVNGGAEVSSGAIKNGDSVVFLMTAPATGNSSNRMVITVSNGTTLGYWRVWTGDPTASITKRIFPYAPNNSPGWGNMGGIGGADSACNSAASAAGLGGSWKALLSGKNENEWAINRIGYNWSRLTRTDGEDVVMAGNIWKSASTPLLSPPIRDAGNTADISNNIITNTTPTGLPVSMVDSGTCANYTSGNDGYYVSMGASGSTSGQWLQSDNTQSCGYQYYGNNYFYCIEQ